MSEPPKKLDFWELDWQQRLFDKSPWQRVRLRRLEEVLGATAGMTCLMAGGDGTLHTRLRRLGGTWHAAARTPAAAEALGAQLGESIHLIKDGKLPLDDARFDRIVILDLLEYMQDDHAFIADCHRALTPTGRLVLHTSRTKLISVVRGMRRLLAIGEPADLARAGYTDSELFDVLKDGFDVEHIQGYSRLPSELTEMLVRLATAYATDSGAEAEGPANSAQPGSYERVHRLLSVAYPFSWLATILDALFFFTRGHYLVAKARRRIWKPRRTPVLSDGRSIAEATLKTRIGTATPF